MTAMLTPYVDELPSTVKSIRDGWQWTCSSGAVVSGLLASAAAQLLSTFKTDMVLGSREPRDRNLVLILCYAALFLNVSATISSFILTDNLGEIEYHAAGRAESLLLIGKTDMNAQRILKKYGASRQWNCMLWHWLITFYLGILTLIMAVLSFVCLAESRAITITMSIIVGFTLIPVTWFIVGQPICELLCPRTQGQTNSGTEMSDMARQPSQESTAVTNTAGNVPMPLPQTNPTGQLSV